MLLYPSQEALEPLLKAVVRRVSRDIVDELEKRIADTVRQELARKPAPEQSGVRVWISPRRAAKMVGVSYDTVLGWISARELEAYRVGRQYRIRKRDLEGFVTAQSPERAQANVGSELSRILGTSEQGR